MTIKAIKLLNKTIMMEKDSERRTEERLRWLSYCYISEEGVEHTTPLIGITQDTSKNGINVSYVGEPLIPGTLVKVHITSLKQQRSAKIMWSKTVSRLDTRAGLKLMEPIAVHMNT